MKLMILLGLLMILGITCTTTYVNANANDSFFDDTSGIINFEPTQLEMQLKSSNPLLLFFYTPRSGKSKTYQPELVKLAKALNGAVQIGALNCAEYAHDCERTYEVGSDDIPTLKLFSGKYHSKRFGGTPNVKSIASFVNQAMPSHVQPIAAITSTESPLNRVILFTDKKDIPTLFKSIATEFEGRLETFVALSTESKDKSFIKKYKVDKFPTLLVENASTKEITLYDGAVSYPAIRAFVVAYASATKITTVAIKEISDQSCLERYCLTSGAGLCVFVIPSESNMENDLQIIAGIQTQRSQMSKMFAFNYFSHSNENVMKFATQAFGVQTGLQRAQVIVYSPKKDKFALYAGAFTAEGINEWLSIVEHGKARVGKLETADGKLPKIEGTTVNCPVIKEEETKKKTDKKQKTEKKAKTEDKKKKEPTIREAEPGELDAPPGTHTESSTIYPISSQNLEQMVFNSPDAWLLIFADQNDESRQIFGTLMQLARKTNNLVKLGLVDMNMDKPLAARYEVESGPLILGFPCGSDKRNDNNIRTHDGANDAKSLYNFAMSLVVSDIVTLLDDEKDYHNFMSSTGSKFVPRVVVFRSSSSATVPPLLAALSHEFPKSIKMASTKSSELKDLFGMKEKGPAVFAISQPTANGDLLTSEAIKYKGEMKKEALKQWLSQIAKGEIQYKRGRVVEWTKPEEGSCSDDANSGTCTAPPADKSTHQDL